ncbi:MAG: protein TolQ [Pseudomonadota bacterium]
MADEPNPVGGTPNITDIQALDGNAAPDFNMISLFFQADIVVKTVMIMLVLASLWSWAVIFDKAFRLRRLERRSRQFENHFWSGQPLEELYQGISQRTDHPIAVIFVAAMREWQKSLGASKTANLMRGVGDRVDTVMRVALNREMADLEQRLGYLATIGSVAPFVGLFGTVWGIINSFQSIAISQNTSLAVVAPGIAEALFATALGLLAAIPAVIGYNRLSAQIDRYAGRAECFCDEFRTLMSRQLDEAA